MSDITYADKIAGSTFSHENANEIKTAINSKVDKSGTKVLSDNNYSDAEKAIVASTSGINTGDQDLSNLQTKPLLSQTFNGEFNLSTGGEVSYKIYSLNTNLTPTVTTPLIENSICRVVIDAGANASLIATNIGTLRAGSDSFTVSKQNELLIFVFPDGTSGALVKSYTIKVLN